MSSSLTIRGMYEEEKWENSNNKLEIKKLKEEIKKYEVKQNGCDFCNGEEYIITAYESISISNFGDGKVLTSKCNQCPPNVDCPTKKRMPIDSSFKIKYCPMCGKRLGKME